MARQSARGSGERCKFYQGLIDTLSAAAESTYELEKLQDDGLSLRIHLESYWRQTGVRPPQLEIEPIPTEVQHVWGWWLQLQETRSSAFSGHSHITYTELDSWARLLDIKVTPFEVQCLMKLDSVFIICHAPEPVKPTEG